LQDYRASFDFAQGEDIFTWHLPMIDAAHQTKLVLSEVEGRKMPLQF